MPFGEAGRSHAASCCASCCPALLQRLLARQPDLARLVDLEDLDVDHVALFEDVGHLPHALVGELRDVHEAVGAGQDLDEGAEVDDLPHRAAVDLPDLGLGGDAADAVERLLHRVAVGRRDVAPCRRPRRRS